MAGVDTWSVPGLVVKNQIADIKRSTYVDNELNADGDPEATAVSLNFVSTVSCERCAEYHWLAHFPHSIQVRPPGDHERACSRTTDGWVSFNGEHIRNGLTLPLPPLLVELLTFYKIALAQLHPNGIRLVLSFMVRCHHLNIPCTAELFRYFFIPCKDSGFISIRQRQSRHKILGCLPKSSKHWKVRYFFIRSAPGECQLNIPSTWNVLDDKVKADVPKDRLRDSVDRLCQPGPRDTSVLSSPELLAYFGIIPRKLTNAQKYEVYHFIKNDLGKYIETEIDGGEGPWVSHCGLRLERLPVLSTAASRPFYNKNIVCPHAALPSPLPDWDTATTTIPAAQLKNLAILEDLGGETSEVFIDSLMASAARKRSNIPATTGVASTVTRHSVPLVDIGDSDDNETSFPAVTKRLRRESPLPPTASTRLAIVPYAPLTLRATPLTFVRPPLQSTSACPPLPGTPNNVNLSEAGTSSTTATFNGRPVGRVNANIVDVLNLLNPENIPGYRARYTTRAELAQATFQNALSLAAYAMEDDRAAADLKSARDEIKALKQQLNEVKAENLRLNTGRTEHATKVMSLEADLITPRATEKKAIETASTLTLQLASSKAAVTTLETSMETLNNELVQQKRLCQVLLAEKETLVESQNELTANLITRDQKITTLETELVELQAENAQLITVPSQQVVPQAVAIIDHPSHILPSS